MVIINDMTPMPQEKARPKKKKKYTKRENAQPISQPHTVERQEIGRNYNLRMQQIIWGERRI